MLAAVAALITRSTVPKPARQTSGTSTNPAPLPSPQPTGVTAPTNTSSDFITSEPVNGDFITPRPASTVNLFFSTPLVAPSNARVTVNGKTVSTSSAVYINRGLGMSVPITATRTGTYLVQYLSCHTNKECNEGQFSFSVQQ
jgi:hypothetical protein